MGDIHRYGWNKYGGPCGIRTHDLRIKRNDVGVGQNDSLTYVLRPKNVPSRQDALGEPSHLQITGDFKRLVL